MKRNDFVFCIGFNGDTAIVDRKLEAQFGRLSSRELFAEGLFRAALASALFEENTADLEWLRQEYGRITGQNLRDVEGLKRTLGVSEVYTDIQRTAYL